MKCSACAIALITMFYEGVRVRICVRCSGVLVGHEELKLIVQRREVEIPREGGLSSVQGSEREQACPACEVVMRKRRYRDAITVDECPACRTVSLDRGELEDLQLLAEMAADEKTDSARDAAPSRAPQPDPIRAGVGGPSPAQPPVSRPVPSSSRPSPEAPATSRAAVVPLAGLAGTGRLTRTEATLAPTSASETTCPKCATVQPAGPKCRGCGIIFAKVAAREAREREQREESQRRVDSVLGRARGLAIREYTGFERLGRTLDGLAQGRLDLSFGDRYDIRDHTGRMVAHACHAAARMHRGWNVGVPIEVVDAQENLLMTLRGTFKLFASRLDVEDAIGARQGAVQTVFSLVSRRVEVLDARDRILMEVVSPIFRPSTFEVRRHGREVGRITKKWAGLFREWQTDADDFGVRFPPSAAVREKMLLLAATLLINAAYFEDADHSNVD